MPIDSEVLYHGTMADRPDPPPGSMAEAVDVFFNRVFSLLPVYVSRVPAIKIGLAAGAIVLLLAAPIVYMEKSKTRTDATPIERLVWLAYLLIALAVAVVVQNVATTIAYNSMMISANQQHFANVHWAREYVRAVRTPMATTLA